MPGKHDTSQRAPDFLLNIGDRWQREQMLVALLADVRRELERSNALLARIDLNTKRASDDTRRTDRRLQAAGFLLNGRRRRA